MEEGTPRKKKVNTHRSPALSSSKTTKKPPASEIDSMLQQLNEVLNFTVEPDRYPQRTRLLRNSNSPPLLKNNNVYNTTTP